MAAQPEMFPAYANAPAPRPVADIRPEAIVLPLLRTDRQGRKLVDETSGDRLGPAQGLLIGLALGVVLWVGLGILAWTAWHH